MTKEERKKYMREYWAKNKRHKHSVDSLDFTGYIFVNINLPVFVRKDLYEKVPSINENEIEIEDEYCSVFGCGEKLSMREKLFGNRCIKHQDMAKNTVARHVCAYNF